MASEKQYKLTIEVGGKVNKSLASAMSSASSAFSQVSKIAGTAMKAAATAVAAATAAAVSFGKKAIEAGMQFDTAMAQVAATMGTTVDQIQELRDFAMEMGSKTAFSATEAAEALNFMALAGYDAETSMAMLPNVLNLAAAGGIELAEASDMITDAQSALGLSIEETTAMVDQMAKASSKTNTSVAQLGEAILTVGGTAQYMAGGTNELASVLGVLADNGIKGSEGGTHLRNILLKLASPTKDATALLDSLGVQVFDAQGKMRSFSEIFPELNAALSTLTDEQRLSAMSTLFNSRDIASATALLSTTTERWDELAEVLGDCEGAAQAMADTQLDNLQGDITLFQSALEGAYITISDQLTPSLRGFVQFGTDSVSKLTEAFKEGGLTGAMGALGGILSDGLNQVIQAAPEAINAGMQLLGSLGQGILDNLPAIVSAGTDIAIKLGEGLIQALPAIAQGAVSLVSSLATSIQQNAPRLLAMGGELLSTIFNGLIQGIPMLAQGAAQLFGDFGAYLQQNLPTLIQSGLEMVKELTASLRENAGILIDGALSLVMSLAQGIADSLPALIENLPDIVSNIAGIINDNAPKLIQTGIQVIVTLATGIVKAIPTLLANLPKILGAIWDAFKAFNWVSLGKTILTGIGGGLSGIGEFFSNSWSQIKDNIATSLKSLPSTLGNIGKTAIEAIKAAASAFLPWLRSLLPGILTAIIAFLQTIPEKVAEFAQAAWDVITGVFGSVAEWFGGVFATSWSAITGAFSAAATWASGIWESIKGGFAAVGNWFGGIFSDAWTAISGAFSAAGTWASGIWESIKGGFGSVAEWFGGVFATAWSAVKDVFSTGGAIFQGITEGITGVFKTVVNGIIDGLNTVVAVPFNGINTALDGIRGIELVGLKPFSWLPTIPVPQIPRLAQGGIVDKPTLLEAGEAHEAEAVIPLGELWKQLNDLFRAQQIGTTAAINQGMRDFFSNQSAPQPAMAGAAAAGGAVTYNITYSPQYTIQGTGAGRQDIEAAERTSQAEFERRMKQFLRDESRRRF